MEDKNVIEGYLGITTGRKKSRMPARLDFWQSATGFMLGIFMIVHMFLVSSILVSKEFMYSVSKFFEGSFIFDGGKPILVSIIGVVVVAIVVAHAGLALRKFPINYRQYKVLKTHKGLMKHGDTTMWFIQAFTGFVLFFTATVHVFVMIVEPHTIGPNGSAYRFVHQHFWVLYIILLLAVELHMSIGMYRLAIKWGWFENIGINGLRRIKTAASVFFIALGLTTFAAYISIGLSQTDENIDYKNYDHIEFGKKH